MSAVTALEAGRRVGDYVLLRRLGAGGMGDVWLASDTRAERHVALKFIKPHLLADAGFRRRFLDEAKTLGRLEHDRIVTLYTVVEAEGHLALVLRFIDGRSLADRIDDEGPMPLDGVLAYARDLLPALGFAHERGIVHRDIKTPNVLLDAYGRAFLTDFGIAVGDFAQRHTMTGLSMGTPHYMSPEQILRPGTLSEAGGHRTDIYSFGVVLFEMLTGRVPFGALDAHEQTFQIQRAHCEEPAPSLRSVNAGVLPAVEAVVMRCLEKLPDDRPQSCAALLQMLEVAVAGAPVDSPPPRPSRAATVVEQRGHATAPSAAAVPVPAVPLPTAARRGFSPKVAWLAVGLLVIAGSVSYAILTPAEKSAAERPDALPPSNPPSSSPTPPVVSSQTPSNGQGQPPQAPLPVRSPTAQPAADPVVMAQAAAHFRAAQRAWEATDFCPAQAEALRAVNLVKEQPGPEAARKLREYDELRMNAAGGCDLSP